MSSDTGTSVAEADFNGGRSAWMSFLIHYGRQVGLPLAVLGLIAIFSLSSEYFLNLQNFRNIGL